MGRNIRQCGASSLRPRPRIIKTIMHLILLGITYDGIIAWYLLIGQFGLLLLIGGITARRMSTSRRSKKYQLPHWLKEISND